MQQLGQETDQSTQGRTQHDHPVLRAGLSGQAASVAKEVKALRQRVAELEAELAAIKATRVTSPMSDREPPPLTTVDFTPPCRPSTLADEPSQFQVVETPAVVPVAEAPESDSGFAEAWEADADVETTVEERFAEREFFHATSVDEGSRSWLLGN